MVEEEAIMATYPDHAGARGSAPVGRCAQDSPARHDRAAAPAFDREIILLAIVVILGTAMTVLDLTIVNVAIPTLGRAFGTSIATIQWVLTGYMLAFASVIPLSGWATARFGARQVWIASLGTFLLGSVLAGLAWSAGALIAFRVIQGLGAGLLMPVGQAALAQTAGPDRMGRVMSLFGVPMLLVPTLGPVIGGAIAEHASWRWIFYLNVPVSLTAIAAAARLLPAARPPAAPRLDLRGLVLLSPGIAAFLYGLSELGSRGTAVGPGVIAAVAAGAALVAMFTWHASRRGPAALVDVSLFRRRGFATASAATFALGVALFGSLVLLPLYYQVVRGQSPTQVGLLLVPQSAGAALAMPLAGWLTDKRGARVVVPAGVIAGALGTLAYTQLGAHTPYWLLAAALLVAGLGIGSTIMPCMAAAFQGLSRQQTPGATSALNVIQRVSGAIGTALLAVFLQRAIAARVPRLHGDLQQMAALPPGQHAQLAPALAGAFGSTFWIAVGLIAAGLIPALLLPGRPQAAAAVPGQRGDPGGTARGERPATNLEG
jgi:EmrB/QacA subfamily drug resistance transporter